MGWFGRKTVFTGDMNVDPALVRQWEEFSQISGRPMHIPGGVDPTSYVKDQEKQGRREAKEFRQRISQEYDEMKKSKTEKPDKKVAEKRAREFMKRKFKWK